MSPNDKSKPHATKPSNDKTGPTRQVVTPTQAKPPANKPAPADKSDDADDDDDDGDSKPSKKLSWKDDKTTRLKRNVSRARWFASVIEANYEDLKINKVDADLLIKRITDAAADVEAAVSEFIRLTPDDFKGRNAPGGRIVTGERKGMLKAGQRVSLKADALKKFTQLFTAEELANLEVLNTSGSTVVLKTGTGARLAIPARQVEEATEAKAA